MSAEVVLFWIFALLTMGSSVGVIVSRSPISAAMSLVASFFFLAGIYVLLWAHTIAVLQVLVYTGAIMVLFLFVIMLLSLTDTGVKAKITPSRVIGGAAAVGLLGALCYAIFHGPVGSTRLSGAQTFAFGSLEHMGQAIYSIYLLPFEAVSLLLLVAIVGAVVVAKSRI